MCPDQIVTMLIIRFAWDCLRAFGRSGLGVWTAVVEADEVGVGQGRNLGGEMGF